MRVNFQLGWDIFSDPAPPPVAGETHDRNPGWDPQPLPHLVVGGGGGALLPTIPCFWYIPPFNLLKKSNFRFFLQFKQKNVFLLQFMVGKYLLMSRGVRINPKGSPPPTLHPTPKCQTLWEESADTTTDMPPWPWGVQGRGVEGFLWPWVRG